MSNENNKCKTLCWLMTTLDKLVVDGVNEVHCTFVAKNLRDYCSEVQLIEAPTVDDFFADDVIAQRTFGAVIRDINNVYELPRSLDVPMGAGDLLFALHEYQHRHHADNETTLKDGLSTLELHARRCIKDCLGNYGWDDVCAAINHTYKAAVEGKGVLMIYHLAEVRKALQDWLPAEYVKIFIDDHD